VLLLYYEMFIVLTFLEKN